MRLYKLKEGDVYISKRRIKEKFVDGPVSFLEERLDHFFSSRPRFREYIDLYGRLNNLPKLAILEAHGCTIGEWVYEDGKNVYTVQSWINQFDGRYSGLLLCVCNSGSHTPKSNKSILVVPDSDIDFTAGCFYTEKEPIFSLLVPKVGEIDLYTIDYEIEKLKKRF